LLLLLRTDQQLIPDDYEYSSVNGDAFVSTDATSQIKEGTEVRIKIVGVRADPHDMVRRREGGTARHSTRRGCVGVWVCGCVGVWVCADSLVLLLLLLAGVSCCLCSSVSGQ
jgi:hypothetical protein